MNKLIDAAKEAASLVRDEGPRVDGHGLLYWHARAKALEVALRTIATPEWPSDYDACDMYEACVAIARRALEGK